VPSLSRAGSLESGSTVTVGPRKSSIAMRRPSKFDHSGISIDAKRHMNRSMEFTGPVIPGSPYHKAFGSVSSNASSSIPSAPVSAAESTRSGRSSSVSAAKVPESGSLRRTSITTQGDDPMLIHSQAAAEASRLHESQQSGDFSTHRDSINSRSEFSSTTPLPDLHDHLSGESAFITSIGAMDSETTENNHNRPSSAKSGEQANESKQFSSTSLSSSVFSLTDGPWTSRDSSSIVTKSPFSLLRSDPDELPTHRRFLFHSIRSREFNPLIKRRKVQAPPLPSASRTFSTTQESSLIQPSHSFFSTAGKYKNTPKPRLTAFQQVRLSDLLYSGSSGQSFAAADLLLEEKRLERLRLAKEKSQMEFARGYLGAKISHVDPAMRKQRGKTRSSHPPADNHEEEMKYESSNTSDSTHPSGPLMEYMAVGGMRQKIRQHRWRTNGSNRITNMNDFSNNNGDEKEEKSLEELESQRIIKEELNWVAQEKLEEEIANANQALIVYENEQQMDYGKGGEQVKTMTVVPALNLSSLTGSDAITRFPSISPASSALLRGDSLAFRLKSLDRSLLPDDSDIGSYFQVFFHSLFPSGIVLQQIFRSHLSSFYYIRYTIKMNKFNQLHQNNQLTPDSHHPIIPLTSQRIERQIARTLRSMGHSRVSIASISLDCLPESELDCLFMSAAFKRKQKQSQYDNEIDRNYTSRSDKEEKQREETVLLPPIASVTQGEERHQQSEQEEEQVTNESESSSTVIVASGQSEELNLNPSVVTAASSRPASVAASVISSSSSHSAIQRALDAATGPMLVPAGLLTSNSATNSHASIGFGPSPSGSQSVRLPPSHPQPLSNPGSRTHRGQKQKWISPYLAAKAQQTPGTAHTNGIPALLQRWNAAATSELTQTVQSSVPRLQSDLIAQARLAELFRQQRMLAKQKARPPIANESSTETLEPAPDALINTQ
jgi:hypothetical protein